MTTKQVIVMRKDLGMRKGKMIAQGSHGSMAFITHPLQEQIQKWLVEPRAAVYTEKISFNVELTEEEIGWILNSFTKVVVYVNSNQELLDIEQKARDNKLTVHRITDNGLTEFHGVATDTCVVLGPHYEERFNGITSDLPLL